MFNPFVLNKRNKELQLENTLLEIQVESRQQVIYNFAVGINNLEEVIRNHDLEIEELKWEVWCLICLIEERKKGGNYSTLYVIPACRWQESMNPLFFNGSPPTDCGDDSFST